MKEGSGDSVFDWNVTGASICYLAAEVLLMSHYLLLISLLLLYMSPQKHHIPTGKLFC